MKKISFITILSLLLFACASPSKYDAELNSLVGLTSQDLLQQMGTPGALKILPDNNQVWAYIKADDTYVSSEYVIYNADDAVDDADDIYSPFLGDLDYSPYTASFGTEVESVCQTVFYIHNNIVTGWQWRGNNCDAY